MLNFISAKKITFLYLTNFLNSIAYINPSIKLHLKYLFLSIYFICFE